MVNDKEYDEQYKIWIDKIKRHAFLASEMERADEVMLHFEAARIALSDMPEWFVAEMKRRCENGIK